MATQANTPAPNDLVAVLDHVRTHGESSRAELAQATGLGRSVLTQRVDALRNYGLLADDRVGVSTGGRAPRLLRFAPTRATCSWPISVPRARTSRSPTWQVGSSSTARSRPTSPPARTRCSRVEQLFEECVAEAGGDRSLWGIGIGVPGPVEFESGRPVSPPIMPGWDGYPLRERFADRGVPVWVDNDVNVMALGELTAGCGRGVDDFVFVKIGTGIGAGIVVDGRIHRGPRARPGDVGHIHVQAGREVTCRCGMSGCLEAFAGGARWRGTRRRRPATAAAGSCARSSTRRAPSTRPTSPPRASTATRSRSS